MRIIDPSKQHGAHLRDIKAGDTFEWQSEYWIKTNDECDCDVRCVSLNTGRIRIFNVNTSIRIVDMEGVIS